MISGTPTKKKRRSACDSCHKAKVRCSGEQTCSRCQKDNLPCHYSYCAHLGKPKGSLNKSTIRKMLAEGQTPPTPRGDRAGSRSQLTPSSPRSEENRNDFPDAPTTLQGPSQPVTPLPSASGGTHFSMADKDLLAFDQLGNMNGFFASLHTPLTTINTEDNFHFNDDPDDLGFAEPPPVSSEDRPTLCACVQSLTAQVNKLNAVVGNRSPSGLDETLRFTQKVVSCVSTFLRCRTCSSRPPAFFIANVVLSMTLSLILPLVNATKEQSQPRTQIRVGSLHTSGQLGIALEKVVVQSMTQNIQGVVDEFETKIDFLPSEKTHLDFLKYEAGRVKRGLRQVAVTAGFGDLAL